MPLIVLAGSVDAGEALSYNHQVFDHGAVFARCCKASFTAQDGAVDVMIDKALGIALAGAAGSGAHRPADRSGRARPAGAARRGGTAAPLPTAPGPGEALERARALLRRRRRGR